MQAFDCLHTVPYTFLLQTQRAFTATDMQTLCQGATSSSAGTWWFRVIPAGLLVCGLIGGEGGH